MTRQSKNQASLHANTNDTTINNTSNTGWLVPVHWRSEFKMLNNQILVCKPNTNHDSYLHRKESLCKREDHRNWLLITERAGDALE